MKANLEKLLFVLPKSCNCHTCIETKNLIKNEIGETRFLALSKEIGLIS